MKCASISTGSDIVSMCIVHVKVKKKDFSNNMCTSEWLQQGRFILDKLFKAIRTSGKNISNNQDLKQRTHQ